MTGDKVLTITALFVLFTLAHHNVDAAVHDPVAAQSGTATQGISWTSRKLLGGHNSHHSGCCNFGNWGNWGGWNGGKGSGSYSVTGSYSKSSGDTVVNTPNFYGDFSYGK